MSNKRPAIFRTKEEWLKIIKDWKQSQVNLKTWCRENGIPSSSLASAYSRLFPNEQSIQNEELNLQRSSFLELKENYFSSVIELSYKNITIRVAKNCDESSLLTVLKVLGRL